MGDAPRDFGKAAWIAGAALWMLIWGLTGLPEQIRSITTAQAEWRQRSAARRELEQFIGFLRHRLGPGVRARVIYGGAPEWPHVLKFFGDVPYGLYPARGYNLQEDWGSLTHIAVYRVPGVPGGPVPFCEGDPGRYVWCRVTPDPKRIGLRSVRVTRGPILTDPVTIEAQTDDLQPSAIPVFVILSAEEAPVNLLLSEKPFVSGGTATYRITLLPILTPQAVYHFRLLLVDRAGHLLDGGRHELAFAR